jgi:hypothetical protein
VPRTRTNVGKLAPVPSDEYVRSSLGRLLDAEMFGMECDYD